jgi:hypothetical protein
MDPVQTAPTPDNPVAPVKLPKKANVLKRAAKKVGKVAGEVVATAVDAALAGKFGE